MTRLLLTIILLSLHTLFFAQNTPYSTFNYNEWLKRQQQKDKTEDSSESRNLVKSTTLYADAFVQAGVLRGFGANIGGFYNDFNLEATYLHGLQESYQIERIYGDAHHYFTYHPLFWSIKAGYGISKLGALRITPQVGFGVVQIRGKQANETTKRGSDNAYATNLVASVRVNYMFQRHFGISIIPEYRITMQKSDSFLDITDPSRGKVTTLSNSSDLRNWIKGFGCRIALSVSL